MLGFTVLFHIKLEMPKIGESNNISKRRSYLKMFHTVTKGKKKFLSDQKDAY